MAKAKKKNMPQWVAKTNENKPTEAKATHSKKVIELHLVTRFGHILGINTASNEFVQIDSEHGDSVAIVKVKSSGKKLYLDNGSYLAFDDSAKPVVVSSSKESAHLVKMEKEGKFAIDCNGLFLTTDKQGQIGVRKEAKAWEEFTLAD